VTILLVEQNASRALAIADRGYVMESGLITMTGPAAKELLNDPKVRAAYLGECLRDWGLENVYGIYPQWLHRYAPGVTHNTERVFGLEVPVGTPVRLNPREHTNYQWLPWQAAADACFSSSNAEAVLMLPRFLG
jgi:dATP pyrophosphohydrolase